MDGLGSTRSGEHPPVSAIPDAKTTALHHALLIGRSMATDITSRHPRISREFGRSSLRAAGISKRRHASIRGVEESTR
jgi:hypothetical protein